MTPDPTRNSAAPKVASFPDGITSALPFNGIVNVRYRGAVIASSENAMAVNCGDGRVFHFVPFRDVNFELLKEHGTGDDGLAYWDILAAGERVPMAVGVIEHPPSSFRQLIARATFVSDLLDVDIVPSAEKAQHLADWPR
jgi:uncharacterized protein (DUF427 family)